MAKYGLNKVTLIGNLGADPELRYLDQGIALVNFSLACTERSRDKDGNYIDRTDWVDVNLWRGQAEVVGKYCRKGSTLYVEGRLITRSWETQEGEKRYKTEVQGQRVILLDSRSATGGSQGGGEMSRPVSQLGAGQGKPEPQSQQPSHDPATSANKPAVGDEDDDLPF